MSRNERLRADHVAERNMIEGSEMLITALRREHPRILNILTAKNGTGAGTPEVSDER